VSEFQQAARPARLRLDEVELLRRARNGDANAFTELVRANETRLRQLTYQLTRDSFAMEVLLQEALLRAYRGLQDFSPEREGSFIHWLCRIVYRVFVDEYRRQKRRPRETDLSHEMSDAAVTPVDEAVVRRLTLDRAIAELPVDVRSAVLLVDLVGFDYATAAELSGTTPGTIASRLHRGRAALLQALQQ